MTNSNRLTMAFEEAPVPILVVSDAGIILQTNKALNELFDYEANALAGQPIEILLPENLQQDHVELREAYMKLPCRRKIGRSSEIFGMTKFGRLIPVEVGLNPIEEDGQRYVVASVTDISLIKTEEIKFRTAIDASASAMIMAELDGTIVFANKHACAIFDYELFEILGLNVDALVPDKHQRRHAIYRTSYAASGTTRKIGDGCELFGKRKDGEEFAVEIGLTPITNGDKKLIMATVIEVSARRSADHSESEAARKRA